MNATGICRLILTGLLSWMSPFVLAQHPFPMESGKLSREIALQKLRVPENVTLRQHFANAGFQESDRIDATTYTGTDSEGEFQMDVVTKPLSKNGQTVLVTTVEFRHAGKVTLSTVAEEADGTLWQAKAGMVKTLYAPGAVAGVRNCLTNGLLNATACQECRTRLQQCIRAPQHLHEKIACLYTHYFATDCRSCTRASLIALVQCFFQPYT